MVTQSDFVKGWLSSEKAARDCIGVKKAYIDINDGKLNDGILFSQIMYWHGNNAETGKPRMQVVKNGERWLAKRYDDWIEECRIPARTAKTVISNIKKRGLIETKVWKFGGVPTLHLRINWDAFEQAIKSLECLDSTEKCQKGPIESAESASSMESAKKVRSITETTNKEYTHSREPDSEQSSGVCLTSLEAPLEKKPASNPVTEDEGVSTLLRNEKTFKKLGVQISGALKSAAHGLTRDDVINAGKALQEAIDSETVKNKQGYLMSALRNRYAPSEEWLKAKEAERAKEQSRLAAEKEQEAKLQQRLQEIDAMGGYRFEYPGIEGVGWQHAWEMPSSREDFKAFQEKRKHLSRESTPSPSTKVASAANGFLDDSQIDTPDYVPF